MALRDRIPFEVGQELPVAPLMRPSIEEERISGEEGLGQKK
jgi:hypothetical protein